MKKIAWLFLGVFLSINLSAQPASAPPPVTTPAPEIVAPTNTPPARANKKKTAKPPKAPPSIVEPAVTLSPGKAIITGKNVNVRAQANINSEVVARFNPGDTVTVLEQINLDKFKPDEPRQWAKIAIPEKMDVWVHTSFIDRTNMTVIPNKLNLRAGPGENYSVVGVVERGAQVKEVLTDGNWMRITAPAGAYAFIAAMYLQQEAPAVETPAVATVPTTPEPQPAVVPPPAEVTSAPPTSPAPEPTNTSVLMTLPPPALVPAEPPPAAQPPPPRVVSHEGVVKRTVSIQAPTDFGLVDPQTGKIVNYLYSPSTNLNLSLYRGLRIVVTGEEGLDERWKDTPVITIKRIHVVE